MSNADQPATAHMQMDENNVNIIYHAGLTKREDFVKAAIQGLLAGGFNVYADDIGIVAVDIANRAMSALEETDD